VKDAVAGRGVERLLERVLFRERAPDARLLLVGLGAGKYEVVVRNGRLAREHGATRDLVEGVDGEGRGPVGRGQEVGVHAQGAPGFHARVLVDAVRPRDLLGGGESARGRFVGPPDRRRARHRFPELAATDGEDPARAANLVLFGR
jgi:hypothetical protein